MRSYFIKENLSIFKHAVRSEGLAVGTGYLARAFFSKYLLKDRPIQPLHAIIEITTNCNLRCPTCAQVTYQKKRINLAIDRFEQILKQLNKTRKVSLLGLGEPFLNPDLPKMIRMCKSRHKHVLLFSNATCLSENNRQMILAEGLNAIHLSLDGATKDTFERLRSGANFDRVVEDVAALTREAEGSQLRIVINMTTSSSNAHELPDMIKLAHRLGINEVVANDIHFFRDDDIKNDFRDQTIERNKSKTESAIKEAAKIARDLKVRFYTNVADQTGKRTCLYPWLDTFISITGEVTPCCLNGWDPDALNFGSIYKSNFSNLWHSEAYVEFRQEMRSGKRPDLCSDCPGYSRQLIRKA